MNSIEELQEDIKNTEHGLAVKRAVLSQMIKDKKAATPFGGTGFGKFYLGAVKAITSPFAKMNQSAAAELDDPVGVEFNDIAKECNAVIKAASNQDKEQPRQVKRMCLRLADHIVELENFIDMYKDYQEEGQEIADEMHKELARLRPTKDTVALKKIEQGLVDGLNTTQPAV